ncbi:MAG: hypothetical protein LR015_10755, partial [Verrucomicrobia bacterium]|nr:hypothetical protein [Verrucomicrobiota bacterium]
DCFARTLYWVQFWHAGVILMCAAGALVGMVAFILIGTLAGMDYSLPQLARNGLRDGGFYALIWAPGTVLVAAFVHGYNRANRPSN